MARTDRSRAVSYEMHMHGPCFLHVSPDSWRVSKPTFYMDLRTLPAFIDEQLTISECACASGHDWRRLKYAASCGILDVLMKPVHHAY